MLSTNIAETSGAGPEQHSISKSVFLHLFPGILIVAFYAVGAKLAYSHDLPTMPVIYLAIAAVLIPFEMGWLFRQAKLQGNGFSLEGIVLMRKPLPWYQYIFFSFIVIAWLVAIMVFAAPRIDGFFIDKVFFWLPDWFYLASGSLEVHGRSALIAIWFMGLIFNGILGPLVEELYFRGYLLPRISYLGKWAPALNALLFSLYHFFTPWQNLVRVIFLVPWIYVVWWKRNVYLSILIHCLVNTIFGSLFVIPQVFWGS